MKSEAKKSENCAYKMWDSPQYYYKSSKSAATSATI